MGKALLSQAIHEKGACSGAFIAVNCEIYGDVWRWRNIGGDRTDNENGLSGVGGTGHGGMLFLKRLDIWRWSYSRFAVVKQGVLRHATGECAAFNKLLRQLVHLTCNAGGRKMLSRQP